MGVYYYISKPGINSVYVFLNFQFYLKMRVYVQNKHINVHIRTQYSHIFKNKAEDCKKKIKT